MREVVVVVVVVGPGPGLGTPVCALCAAHSQAHTLKPPAPPPPPPPSPAHSYQPFYHDSQDELFRQIRAGRYSFEVPAGWVGPNPWAQVSPLAKDLVQRMLQVEPARRITMEQVLNHPWLTLDTAMVPNVRLSGAVKEIKRLQARKRFRKAVDAVRLTIRMKLGMASKALKLARRSGLSREAAEAAFFQGAQRTQHVRAEVEADMGYFPEALVAGGRRVTTHQFKLGEAAPLSPEALARARSFG